MACLPSAFACLCRRASPLQDEEALSTYKIQSSHTIHMVKGAARNSAASSSQGGPPPQALPQMQAGQNVHDPLTQLNGHMGFGVMGGLNPFAELGLNTNDPNLVSTSCSGCVRCETRGGLESAGVGDHPGRVFMPHACSALCTLSLLWMSSRALAYTNNAYLLSCARSVANSMQPPDAFEWIVMHCVQHR